MPISEQEFAAELCKHILRFTDIGSQAGDSHLVETLKNYVLGLLSTSDALSTSDGRAKLCLLLREFFEDSTDSFVGW